MDAYEAIISKRDRREFDTRPLPEDSVHRILQAGRMAGSSSNRQPLRYVVLRDRQGLEALRLYGRGTGTLATAPMLVLALLTEGGSGFDVGRALQNMMVSAWSEGIISCPAAFQDQEGVKKALGIPADHSVAMGIVFGYAAEGAPPSSNRGRRLPLEEIVHWERW